jgi:hypothetical protein
MAESLESFHFERTSAVATEAHLVLVRAIDDKYESLATASAINAIIVRFPAAILAR